jgi:hypothetical protein
LRRLGEGGGFTQYSRGLSPPIPTKTLVPNKALRGIGGRECEFGGYGTSSPLIGFWVWEFNRVGKGNKGGQIPRIYSLRVPGNLAGKGN